jgi:DNA mismatch endonuclease, patch repair protein
MNSTEDAGYPQRPHPRCTRLRIARTRTQRKLKTRTPASARRGLEVRCQPREANRCLGSGFVDSLPEQSWARDANVRKIMLGNRSRDTRPEVVIRARLHADGLRFFKHRKPLRGLRCEADIVFPTERVAVFVDGCFWHGCPEHWHQPTTNGDFWRAKVQRNIARDVRNDRVLREAGWAVVRVWEHEPPASVASRVAATVRARR